MDETPQMAHLFGFYEMTRLAMGILSLVSVVTVIIGAVSLVVAWTEQLK